MLSTTLKKIAANTYINADGLRVDRFGQPVCDDPFIGIVHMGDLHMTHSSGSNLDTDAAASEALFVNSITTIIAKKAEWNVKAFVTPGDLVDFTQTVGGWLVIEREFNRLIAANIWPIVCPGNHDGSTANDAEWTRVLSNTLFSRHPYWTGIKKTSNTKTGIYLIENGPLKLGFIASSNFSADLQGPWIKEAADMFPSYNFIAMKHTYTDAYGFDSETLAQEYVKNTKNIFAVISAHYRMCFGWAHSYSKNSSGRIITNIYMNNQQQKNGGNNFIRLYKVFSDKIEVSMYDNFLGRFLKNGEEPGQVAPIGMKLGYYSNFSFPIFGYNTLDTVPILPQFINNTGFNTINGAQSAAGVAMVETYIPVTIPFSALAPDGVKIRTVVSPWTNTFNSRATAYIQGTLLTVIKNGVTIISTLTGGYTVETMPGDVLTVTGTIASFKVEP